MKPAFTDLFIRKPVVALVVNFLIIIAGVVLNTIFLVREIKRNEQHDAFLNAVTHELKTPVGAMGVLAEALLASTDDAATVGRSTDSSPRASFHLAGTSASAMNISRVAR